MQPPKDPPGVVFRRCLEVPRPSVPIASPFPRIELRCQALASFELGEIDEVLVAAVVDRSGARVLSTALLQRIMPREHDRLQAEVERALVSSFPCIGLNNLETWRALLAEGARDPRNRLLVRTLGTSVDKHMGGTTERPDRFFGLPLHQLIDCHWLAFWAARAHVALDAPQTK